jgi:hypothetical protein
MEAVKRAAVKVRRGRDDAKGFMRAPFLRFQ